MKRILFVSSLSSLLALSSAAFAEQMAYAPTLEGGMTASVGTFYAVPGSDVGPYAEIYDTANPNPPGNIPVTSVFNNTEYDWGFEASLGYVFENTANGIELSYRGLNADSNDSVAILTEDGTRLLPPGADERLFRSPLLNEANNELKNEFNAVDLMLSQFLDIGDYVQMRFLAGISYVEIEQNSDSTYTSEIVESFSMTQNNNSEFKGFGPRVGADGRYDFGQGFGIVAGASLAYFLGDVDSNTNTTENIAGNLMTLAEATDDLDNHAVLNLRGNIGIDYVYYFGDEESTLGIELGYLADYYDEAINEVTTHTEIGTGGGFITTTRSESELLDASYSGPYLLLKGVF